MTKSVPRTKNESRKAAGDKLAVEKRMPVVDNWHRYERGNEVQILEFPIYTDIALITGEHACGPYSFCNPVTMTSHVEPVVAGVILRYVEAREAEQVAFPSVTDARLYHGGRLVDEVAALMSLFLGARFAAGGLSRIYGGGVTTDPRGKPVGWARVPIPQAVVTTRRPVVPSALGQRNLQDLADLDQLPVLTPKQSIGFIRAARLFQDALWICEREPALAWIMLVSALESAANSWRREGGEPLDRLRASKPEFVAQLEAYNEPMLPKLVAETFIDSLGSTKKFIDFCLVHLPPIPKPRPPRAFQIQWSKTSWEKHLRMIYRYRSKALHEGIPFPSPMCEAPYQCEKTAHSERGTEALAVRTRGGHWEAEDLPTNLNVFVQFTRQVLLVWLKRTTAGGAFSKTTGSTSQRAAAARTGGA